MNLTVRLPSGPEVRVDVWKGRAILPEIAVERGGEALKRHAEVAVEALQDCHRQTALVLGALPIKNYR